MIDALLRQSCCECDVNSELGTVKSKEEQQKWPQMRRQLTTTTVGAPNGKSRFITTIVFSSKQIRRGGDY